MLNLSSACTRSRVPGVYDSRATPSAVPVERAVCEDSGFQKYMTQLALLVEPDTAFLAQLSEVTERFGYEPVRCGTFESARESLRTRPPHAVVTNIRLGMFNGIHLIYLATVVRPDVRAVVYSSLDDPVLAREAQRACAFYERQRFVLHSLPNYLTASLPSRDRRDVQLLDRRQVFRGGRRTTDAESLRDSSMSHQGSA